MKYEVHHSDCVAFMRTLPDNHVDAIVTDPPYELGFMGKGWDKSGIANSVEMWSETLRILKPGGHLLAFSGSRTYHRMTCAIEDAGFDIRDQIMWVYGSGFPKSLDVSKAIDKAAGAERTEVIGKGWWPGQTKQKNTFGEYAETYMTGLGTDAQRRDITAPATDAAKQWHGWGTALKPAHEPICVARKPLDGTVAHNVTTWGAGGMNIDRCRVGTDLIRGTRGEGGKNGRYSVIGAMDYEYYGRWPSNFVHDGSEEVVGLFPESKDGVAGKRSKVANGMLQGLGAISEAWGGYGAAGSAARFFYCAKASKADRGEGNHHPTVKPTELMRYLCRLVTPPGGLIFDPFTGSGSTGKAAVLEGFDFLGCDMTAEYVEIARARIQHAAKSKPNTLF